MDARLWQTARWFVALGASVLVVLVAVPLALDALSASLVFGDGDDEAGDPDVGPPVDDGSTPAEPAGQVPTGPVADGESPPDADLVVRDGVVRQAATNRLMLGEAGDVAVTVFPLVEGDPGCVAVVELEMQLEEADATEVAVYASSVHTIPTDGDEIDPLLDGTVRALAFTDGTPGRLRWDVTEVYRAWATGQLAPAGTPFAVVVAPPEEPAELTFYAREAGARTAPALVWEGEAGCGGDS